MWVFVFGFFFHTIRQVALGNIVAAIALGWVMGQGLILILYAERPIWMYLIPVLGFLSFLGAETLLHYSEHTWNLAINLVRRHFLLFLQFSLSLLLFCLYLSLAHIGTTDPSEHIIFTPHPHVPSSFTPLPPLPLVSPFLSSPLLSHIFHTKLCVSLSLASTIGNSQDPLLVCIVAGYIATNQSRNRRKFLTFLAEIAPWIFIPFFTLVRPFILLLPAPSYIA